MMRFSPRAPTRRFRSPPGRENAHHHVEYATVRATVAQITGKALLLTNEGMTAPKWVPLFRLETSSRVRAASFMRGQEVVVQVELQFALDEGLV